MKRKFSLFSITLNLKTPITFGTLVSENFLRFNSTVKFHVWTVIIQLALFYSSYTRQRLVWYNNIDFQVCHKGSVIKPSNSTISSLCKLFFYKFVSTSCCNFYQYLSINFLCKLILIYSAHRFPLLVFLI